MKEIIAFGLICMFSIKACDKLQDVDDTVIKVGLSTICLGILLWSGTEALGAILRL